MMRSRVSLEQVTDRIGDGLHGTPKYSETGDIPFINGNNLKSGRIAVDGKTKYVNEDEYEKHAKSLNDRTVLLSINGTIGNVAQYRGERVVLGKSACYLKCNEDIDPRFLVYLLNDRVFQGHIRQTATGTTIKNVSLALIREYEFDLPLISDQKAIAHILGTLDDKIELNQKMNQTLEEIAKAIFKSWFVDFDPVRAKMEGRPTGLPAAIDELFPEELVDSEIGEIPKGWSITPLPDAIDFLEGPGIRNWQYTNDESGIRFINIRCIKDGDLSLDSANRITEEEALGKYAHFALKEDDIVVSTSGTLGRHGFVRSTHLPLTLNTSVIRFRPVKGKSTLHFLSGFVQTQLQWELETRASGSVQRNFGPMHLKQIELLLPPFPLLSAHQNLVEPFFRKRQMNLQEIELLTELRDTLLPKLISGQLRIPDAEKFLEEAGI